MTSEAALTRIAVALEYLVKHVSTRPTEEPPRTSGPRKTGGGLSVLNPDLTLTKRCPKHAGKHISEVPPDYIKWVIEKFDNLSERERSKLQAALSGGAEASSYDSDEPPPQQAAADDIPF